MRLPLAFLALSFVCLLAAVYYAYGRVPDELLSYILGGVNETLSRVVVAIAFSVVVFIQVGIASETYTDSEAEAFLFDVMGITTSLWEVLVLMLLAWALTPVWVKIVSLTYRIKIRGDDVTTEDYWSGSA